ncbi:NADase-type glycan-binding domain-containing protein [Streptomyces sp. NPDC088147]|uniref:NADase-type glycan-binding domain-containing protein n=1 Tax=unclassified Streptomyces TaxID=2593676 RepID=UPI0033AD4FC3
MPDDDTDEGLGDDREPDAVLPQAPPSPRPRREHRTARANTIQPGHLVCGDCGQGNAPARRFCSRCGSELNEAVVARAPWWHRLRPRRGPRIVSLGAAGGTDRGAGPSVAPGERGRKFWVGIKVVAGFMFFVSSFLYASYAPFRNEVNRQVTAVRTGVKDVVESRYSPVRPDGAVAAKSAKGHAPGKAIDMNTATYWSASYDPDDPSADNKVSLTMKFDRVVSLNQLIIHAGAVDEFTDHGRPRRVFLKFTNEKQVMLTLQDTAKPQKFALKNAVGIKTVRITVADVFPSPKGDDVAVSELEFFSLLS